MVGFVELFTELQNDNPGVDLIEDLEWTFYGFNAFTTDETLLNGTFNVNGGPYRVWEPGELINGGNNPAIAFKGSVPGIYIFKCESLNVPTIDPISFVHVTVQTVWREKGTNSIWIGLNASLEYDPWIWTKVE